eukprot:gene9033-10704_t
MTKTLLPAGCLVFQLIFALSADANDLEAFVKFPSRASLVRTRNAQGAENIAWLETVGGVTNVWLASEEDAWRALQVTHFDVDDASDISNLQFLPDVRGRELLLLFVRKPHSDTNPYHYASPSAAPSGTFVAGAAGGALQISHEGAASVSPDGLALLIVRDATACPVTHPALCVGVTSSVWAQPIVLPTVGSPLQQGDMEATFLFGVKQGSISGLTWRPSPTPVNPATDLSVIAFANDRGDHGFVGIFQYAGSGAPSPSTQRVTWVSPSVDTDSQPVWSPDGARLAWMRLRVPPADDGFSPNDGNEGNRGPDFGIMVVDVVVAPSLDGEGDGHAMAPLKIFNSRQVFLDETYGLSSFGYGSRPLSWVGSRHLLFSTEALSGWLHAAVVHVEPSPPPPSPSARRPAVRFAVKELRTGSCEDRAWAVGPPILVGSPATQHAWVYLASNCQCLDSRGVERVLVRLPSEGPGDGSVTVVRVETLVVADAYTVSGMSDQGDGMVVGPSHFTFLQSTWNSPVAVKVKKSSSNTTDTGSWSALGAPSFVLKAASSPPVSPKYPTITVTNDTISSPVFKPSLFAQPVPIEFPSADGKFTLHGQLFMPPEAHQASAQNATFPGVVYTHGGSERQVFAAFHYSGVYAQQYAVNQWLAAHGLVVLSVNYRSGVGFGPAFRLCADCMWHGGAEYPDVRQAAILLGNRTRLLASMAAPPASWVAEEVPPVDPARIGIWGISYGGLNALQAVTRNSDLFAASVSIAGIFNWVSQSRYVTDTGLTRTDGVRSPGDADEEVDFQELVGVVRALRAQ